MLTQDLEKTETESDTGSVLISGSRTRAKRLAEDLRDYDLSSFYSEDHGTRSESRGDHGMLTGI